MLESQEIVGVKADDPILEDLLFFGQDTGHFLLIRMITRQEIFDLAEFLGGPLVMRGFFVSMGENVRRNA